MVEVEMLPARQLVRLPLPQGVRWQGVRRALLYGQL